MPAIVDLDRRSVGPRRLPSVDQVTDATDVLRGRIEDGVDIAGRADRGHVVAAAFAAFAARAASASRSAWAADRCGGQD
jgi:hypothetical protein